MPQQRRGCDMLEEDGIGEVGGKRTRVMNRNTRTMAFERPDDALFVTGIDHRLDFAEAFLNVDSTEASAADFERAAHLKGVVFAGVAAAVEAGLPKSQAGVWADANLGEAALLRARGMSLVTVTSVERPKVTEFQFEDALGFAEALKRLDATYAGARIRYNPGEDPASNESVRHQLRRLSEICRSSGPKLLVELMITPTSQQISESGGYSGWESDARTMVMVNAVRELQDSGVEPDVWVIDPPLNPDAASTISAQMHVDDRHATGVMFLVGNDAETAPDDGSHDEVITLAARTPGVTGLLMGPAVYRDAVDEYQQGKIDWSTAVNQIAANVGRFLTTFTEARRTSDVS